MHCKENMRQQGNYNNEIKKWLPAETGKRKVKKCESSRKRRDSKNMRNCGVQFAYTESDIQYGEYGCPYITCPGCGTTLDLLSIRANIITLDTLNIPGILLVLQEGVKISDEKCAKFVKEVCQFLKSCKEGEP